MPKKKEVVDETEGIDFGEEKSESKGYDLDHLPDDFKGDATEKKVYPPLPADVYQVEILAIEIKDNIFYDPTDPKSDPVDKYTTSVTLVVIEDGKFYGRQLWDNFSSRVKPTGKKGPTKTYKFVTAVLDSAMDWTACEGFVSEFGKNMKNFIGKQLRITVEVGAKEDGTPKNKIASYMVVKSELPAFDKRKLEKK